MNNAPHIFIDSMRILFGLLFCIKLYFVFQFRFFVWPKIMEDGGTKAFLLEAGIFLLGFVSALFAVGLFTDLSSIFLYIGFLILFRLSLLYSIEEVLFHSLVFYFAIADVGRYLSLDSWLDINLFVSILPEFVAEVCLLVAIGCIFLSSGMNKVLSSLWKTGLGVYYFFWMPQQGAYNLSFMLNRLWLMKFLNLTTLVMQLGFLPAVLFWYRPFGMLFWAASVGFALALIVLCRMLWIGISLMFGLFIPIGAFVLGGFDPSAFIIKTWSDVGVWSIAEVLVFFSLGCAVYLALFPKQGQAAIYKLDTLIRVMARLTWGLVPVRVFTERSLKGSVIYRVVAEMSPSNERQIFGVVSEECLPMLENFIFPSLLLTTRYKITDVSVEIDRYGEVQTRDSKRVVRELARFFTRRLDQKEKTQLKSLRFEIKQIIPPEVFAGAQKSYLTDAWVPAFRLFLGPDTKPLEVLSKPILQHSTGRDL